MSTPMTDPSGLVLLQKDGDGRSEWQPADRLSPTTVPGAAPSSTVVAPAVVEAVNPPLYSEARYWEARYVERGDGDDLKTFEWYAGWRDLSLVLEAALANKAARLMHLGNGNSRLPEEMWRAGYRCQVCNDVDSARLDSTRLDST